MYARIKWMPFGLVNQVDECLTEKDYWDMVKMLTSQRVWFDVDFPGDKETGK